MICPNFFNICIPSFAQNSGFGRGILVCGDPYNGSYCSFNRTLSFATYTESSNTNISTGNRIVQGMSGFSPSHTYHMKGYLLAGSTATTVNKLSAYTATETVPTISFSVERRGGGTNMPHYQRSRLYFYGGYSDSLGQYRADTTYVTQNTDTATNATSLPAGRHMAGTIWTSTNAYIMDGYTTGGGYSNTTYKYVFSSDTASTSTASVTVNQNPYGMSSNVYGYRCFGTNIGYTGNNKLSWSTETWATAPNGPESQSSMLGGCGMATQTDGFLWTGYQSYLKRILYRLTWSTETWTNNSYTTADANSGFILYSGIC